MTRMGGWEGHLTGCLSLGARYPCYATVFNLGFLHTLIIVFGERGWRKVVGYRRLNLKRPNT